MSCPPVRDDPLEATKALFLAAQTLAVALSEMLKAHTGQCLSPDQLRGLLVATHVLESWQETDLFD